MCPSSRGSLLCWKHVFSDESNFDDSVIDSTYTDSHGGSTSKNESDEDNADNSDDGVESMDANPASPSKDVSKFTPKFSPSTEREFKITDCLTKKIFNIPNISRMWPLDLSIHMVYYTNQRLQILEKQKKKIKKTSPHEMMSLVGCLLVMCFAKLPKVNCYWSTKPSMGNAVIKATFSRDRFKLLSSKMYFNTPKKTSDASKTFYVDELLSCLKSTFQSIRQDRVFQSLDESMTKFKGRSSFKQYMPAKPVKRGIKVWMRCDSLTGYTYDMNIYVGKETVSQVGTLGKRVVKQLVSSIKESDVTLAFDRYFTSVNLMGDLNFAAVGTCMKNRKNMPKDAVAIQKR
uniref:piggyBac transposable element-derived protein 2-like n=1 Tax=Styela clava TaxID=7725 RepID=UPI0019396C28|nr:piggyBac transposable element-derived protein 2-like [Styela clava]